MKSRSGKKVNVLNKGDKAFLDVLQQHFEEKKKTNFRYSIRAYAEHLDVDQSLLSKVLRGEKSLSPERQVRCLQNLKVSTEFVQVVKSPIPKLNYKLLDEQMMEVMSDWRHDAILEFMTLKDVKQDSQSIAERLNMTKDAVEKCIERLVSLNLLVKNEDGAYEASSAFTTHYDPKKTSKAKRKMQKSLLEESIKSIDNVPYELRDHSSVTVAINKERMPEIKEILQDARRKITTMLQKDGDFDEVYQLNISFFPLTKIEGHE
jgi:uncharacterized protein (TIGR02147 family)